MISLNNSITIDDLYGQPKEIAELIGMENYKKLTLRFGGEEVYIQKHGELVKIERNKRIRNEFTGWNSTELARKYDLSERYIRDLCSDLMSGKRSAPLPGQLTLW